jgi:ribosomal protein S15P/S13E
MQGKLNVIYQLICDNDTHKEIPLKEILANEKVIKLLKSEFAKGIRNLQLSTDDAQANIIISTEKELYHFEANKKDFADLIELAEEDAKKRKLFKKGCDAVEIMDFETLG